MKLKDVFFRKMTILYIVLIGLLSFELFIVGPSAIMLKENIDSIIRTNTFIVSFKSEPKEIKGVELKEKIKPTLRVVKNDDSLTGDECIVSSILMPIVNEGTIYLDSPNENGEKLSCTVKDYTAYNKIYPYEVLISNEKYNSIKDDYTYIASVNSLGDLNKLFRNENLKGVQDVFSSIYMENYLEEELVYKEKQIIIGISIAMLFVVILVLFFNTSYYIKANKKKTKKKVKDNSLNLTIKSATLTILLGISIGYLAMHLMVILDLLSI